MRAMLLAALLGTPEDPAREPIKDAGPWCNRCRRDPKLTLGKPCPDCGRGVEGDHE